MSQVTAQKEKNKHSCDYYEAGINIAFCVYKWEMWEKLAVP